MSYHDSRLPADAKRNVVWRTLWRHHFSPRIDQRDCVLDLGCGYGEFINNVHARRRIAVDQWEGMAEHLAPGVEPVVSSVTDLSAIDADAVDMVFASNLFEHLSQDEVGTVLEQLERVLSARGSLTLIQPNYRYAAAEYWDDYTHVTAWSHVSLPDFLRSRGWMVIDVRPRFLPLTVKSRLPVHPLLIAAYLRSPVKPLGKQMLIEARPGR